MAALHSPPFEIAGREWRFELRESLNRDELIMSLKPHGEPILALIDVELQGARDLPKQRGSAECRASKQQLRAIGAIDKTDSLTVRATIALPAALCISARQRLGSFLSSGAFSDVILSVAGTSIRAHKAILAHHSPVFKAMFAYKMQEALESKVTIDDIDEPSFQQFLR